MPDTPLSRYHRMVQQCEIKPDAVQLEAITQLQRLFETLSQPDFFNAMGRSRRKPLKGIFSRKKPALERRAPRPSGVYIWGDVGRGKSMLMDLFYLALPITLKKRLHFLQFMLDVHARIHQHRLAEADADPILAVARAIAQECHVLCFDELQVHDITDAMILSRLFTALFEAGVVVVFTSNRPPESLYLGGLQREKFIPFIDLLHKKMQLLELNSPQDYRRGRVQALTQTYFTPLGSTAADFLDAAFLTLSHHAGAVAVDVPVKGRVLHIERTCADMARFSFAELCAQPLGALDYLALTALFKTFLISDIPILSPENRNEAKRFVTLVDVLYEAHATLICTAAAEPDALYVAGDGSFEFARTASRLKEMQSEGWFSQ